MAMHGAWGGVPEFYFSCAQVKVTGSGTGTPGPLVKIPGMYNLKDPAFNFNIYNSPKSYPYIPGPAVWNGGGSSGGGGSSPTPTSTPPPSSGGSCSAKYG